jgi:hypothetical protein
MKQGMIKKTRSFKRAVHKSCFICFLFSFLSRNDSDSKASAYGMEARVRHPAAAGFFFSLSRPDRLGDATSLLSNGFPGDKLNGA